MVLSLRGRSGSVHSAVLIHSFEHPEMPLIDLLITGDGGDIELRERVICDK